MICPGCFTLCPDGQSMCADCGRPLPLNTVVPAPAPRVRGCTCSPRPSSPHEGYCDACYFAELEGIPV